jgi:radical SAM protein with 4Fe4S-binding SPASM domain
VFPAARIRKDVLNINELKWIDGFFSKIRKHIFVRETDNVLILPPNKVFKLNKTGLKLVLHLLKKHKITKFPGILDSERAEQVHNFFCDLKSFYLGCVENPDERKAVERTVFDLNFTRLPILGEIAVTYRCNNKCLFCYADCDIKRTGELDPAGIKKIIDIFKNKAKIPFFSFTGGEPLLRKDLEKMISYAKKTGLQINLITNGTLADKKRAKSLYKSGLRTAQVSIESHDSETHDLLTGSAGSFDKTLSGIKSLQDAGISVQTNTTISRINEPEIEKLPAFIKNLGIRRFSMNLYIPSGRGLYNKELFLPYSETGQVIEKIRKQAIKEDLTFFWYSPVPYCYYNPVARGLGNKSCAAMDGLLSVSPSGDVLPCSSYPESMGSLLDQSFDSIWFSERARFFKNKKYMPEECGDCSKFTACQSACPLYWKYAGTGEIRNCAVKKEAAEIL